MLHERTVYLFGQDQDDRRTFSLQLGRFGVEAWPFEDAEQFIAFLEHSQPGTIIIITGDSPPSALRMVSEIRALGIEWPVIIASNAEGIATAVEAMKRGALDFLQLPVADPVLQSALLMANNQLDRLTPVVEGRRQAQERLGSLTPRERAIAVELQRGGLNKVIAYQLGISVRTVEAHRANIMVKLGVRNFAEAIMLISRAGLPIGAGSATPRAPAMAHIHAARAAPSASADIAQDALLRA